MVNDLDRYSIRRQEFPEDFDIGLILDSNAKAYYYLDVERVGMINDQLGDFPILVWVDRTDYWACA
jgi:hypothetical protein